MHCDIIIPIWNQLEYTKCCIDSVFRFTHFPFKLILIDNGSEKLTAQYLQNIKQGHPEQVDLIRNNENLGWVKAVNQGIYNSTADYVCAMNNDTVVYPEWLSEMVSIAEKDKSIGLINPLWELPKRFRRSQEEYFNKIVVKQRETFIETDWARGFCFLIKREVIDAIGGLDEIFSPGYYDDWDFSIRAISAGFKCVRAKGAFVQHYINVTSPEVLGAQRFNRLFQEKGEIFYKKWGKPLKILLIVDKQLNKDIGSCKDLASLLLKGQNKLFVISSQKELDIKHTNYTTRYWPNFLLCLRAIGNILDNFRHSLTKRYDLILCSPQINKLFQRFPSIRNNYFIKELDSCLKNKDEFLKQIAELKKTKNRKKE